MKKSIKISIFLTLLLLVFTSCDNNYIDPITQVDPGPDAGAPTVTIVKPVDGFAIQVPDALASVNIEVEAEDDIELRMITVSLDGNQIASYENGNNDTFTDYRIVSREFTYDNVTTGDHVLMVKATDLAGNVTTVTSNFSKKLPYTPQYDGEMFYMPFEGSYTNLVNFEDATVVGSPSFGTGVVSGTSYLGAADSYLTFPSADLTLGNEFSATFWLKIDASDDRAGIINIAPADPAGPSDKTSGFGLIREGSATAQTFILLAGSGSPMTWVNPGAPATIDPSLNEWVHFGITISENYVSLYMNGELVGQSDFTGIDWTGVGDLVIMSGDPNFNGWNHKTEKGQMDELYLYNKALSTDEVTLLMNDGL